MEVLRHSGGSGAIYILARWSEGRVGCTCRRVQLAGALMVRIRRYYCLLLARVTHQRGR